MQILKIENNKKDFLDLLLLADEQEDMIDKYLSQGDMFALYDNGLKSICVVVQLEEGMFELKNIATYVDQGLGYGKTLINHLFVYYKDKCKSMLVGTGETPATLSFYESCGFKISHRIQDFFTKNYRHPIYEDGIKLVDMVFLKKDLD